MERGNEVIDVSLGAVFSELTAIVLAKILFAVYFDNRTSAFTANQLTPSTNIEALAENVEAFIADTYMFAAKV